MLNETQETAASMALIPHSVLTGLFGAIIAAWFYRENLQEKSRLATAVSVTVFLALGSATAHFGTPFLLHFTPFDMEHAGGLAFFVGFVGAIFGLRVIDMLTELRLWAVLRAKLNIKNGKED